MLQDIQNPLRAATGILLPRVISSQLRLPEAEVALAEVALAEVA